MTHQPEDRQKRMPRRPLRRAGQPFAADPSQNSYTNNEARGESPASRLRDRGPRSRTSQGGPGRFAGGRRTRPDNSAGPRDQTQDPSYLKTESPAPQAKGPKTGFSGKEKLAALILFVLLLALLIVVAKYKYSPQPQTDLQAGSKPLTQGQEEGQGQDDDQVQGKLGEDQDGMAPDQGTGQGEDPAQAAKTPQGADGETFTIAAVGDVLIHDAILNAGAQEDGTYDFRPLFTHLAPIIEQADLAAFDMEGVFRGAPYAGYPSFSVPEDLADNLKDLGFDLAITANNHAMDFDVDAMMRTARVAKEAGLIPVGTRADFGDPTFFIQDINGIKVGISAFTYESPRQGTDLSLRSFNNVPISVKNSQLIDSFYVSLDWPDFWEEDAARLEDRVKEMRKAGAEVIIFFMHWGTEYAEGRDQAQGYYAQVLANSGVDLVLGCGPHVIQEIRAVPAEEGDHTMLCFYSVGNCVSNQQYDTGNSEGRAQDGLVALASFKRGKNGKVALDRAGYVAHTVYKEYPEKGDRPYTKALAIPIEQGLKDPQAWQLTDQALADLKAAQSRVKAIMDTNEPRDLPLQAYSGFFE